jgi:hypothetical protein
MVNERSTRSWISRAVRRSRRFWEGEFDENALRAVPAWGVSVLMHGMMLLVLAVMIQLGRDARKDWVIQPATLNTEIGDATSLLSGIGAGGDPAAEAESVETPNVGAAEGAGAVRLGIQPVSLGRTTFERSLVSPTLGMSPRDLARTVVIKPKRPGPNASGGAMGKAAPAYSGRSAVKRAKLVQKGGGTSESEAAVERGIAWLARHQREDGSWSFNHSEQCQSEGCSTGAGTMSDTAATGLALLPILGHGYTHMEKTKYQDCVRRGIEWLVAHQQENGDLFIGPPGMAYMYSHAIGTMALCEAYGMTQDARLEGPARMAVEFIIEAQNSVTGGWRYAPGQDGDTSVFGWQIFAFRSAVIAGIIVPKGVLEAASHYLDLAGDGDGVTYGYKPGQRVGDIVMTAEALACRQILGWRREFPPLVKGASYVAADLEQTSGTTRNLYYWYYATQLLKNMRNDDWKTWNVMVRDGLINMQMHDAGCGHGSWDPRFPMPDRWGLGTGRLYETALSLLILEVYYRYPSTDGVEEPETSPGVESGMNPLVQPAMRARR